MELFDVMHNTNIYILIRESFNVKRQAGFIKIIKTVLFLIEPC